MMADPTRSPTTEFWSAPSDLLIQHEDLTRALAGHEPSTSTPAAPLWTFLEDASGRNRTSASTSAGPHITRDTDVLLPDSEAWGDYASDFGTAGSSSHGQASRARSGAASGSGSRVNAEAGPSTLPASVSWSMMHPPSPGSELMLQDLINDPEEEQPPPTQLSVGFDLDLDTDIHSPPPSQPPSLPPSHNPSLILPNVPRSGSTSGLAQIMIIDDDDEEGDARDMEELERTIGIPNDGSFTAPPSEASRAESVDPHRQPRRMAELLNPSPSRSSQMSISTDEIQILDHDPFIFASSSSGAGPGPSTERARKRPRVVPPAPPPPRGLSPDVEIIPLPNEPKPVIVRPKTPPKPVPTAAAPLSNFNCPICFSPPTRATLMPCGHVCCGECLFTSVKTMQRRNAYAGGVSTARCPVCRAEIAGWDGRGGGVVGLIVQVVQPL